MTQTEKHYLPAAGHDWLLPFYDLFGKLLGIESLHRRLADQAGIRPGYRVLEIGCGTGNLAILVQRLAPTASVVGIDPDPKALSRARQKVERGGLTTEFRQAFAEDLPFSDASFDAVLSALMLHHIPADLKLPALAQAYRVLKPNGSLHLADFAGAHRGAGHSVRQIHAPAEPHPQSGVLDLMLGAGFTQTQEVGRQSTILGPMAYYSGKRPPTGLSAGG